MSKPVFSTEVFAILLLVCLSFSAWGFDPHQGAGPHGGGMAMPAGHPGVFDDLEVTLEIPRTSLLVNGLALPPEESRSLIDRIFGPDVIRAKVEVDSEEFAKLPLVAVADEAITLRDYAEALNPPEGESPPSPGQDPAELLDRLIDSRVIVREGREIGLGELDEVKNLVHVYRRQTLRKHLINKHIQGVPADEGEVEKLYREAIKESKIRALVFTEVEGANAFRAQLEAGEDFDDLLAEAVVEGKAEAKGGAEGEYVHNKGMVPEVAEALSALEVGSVTPVLSVDGKFMVFRIEEARSLDDPAAMETARQQALNFAQNRALIDLNKALSEKYVTLDEELFKTLDFENKFEDLLKDKRVLAEVEGGEPILVSGLTEIIKEKYYHGVDRAILDGKVERDKYGVLNEILFKELFVMEALAQKVDQTEAFQRDMKGYERSVIFGAFIRKVIVPDSRITMTELRDYYERHIDDYTYPEMLGIHSLVFDTPEKAQGALNQLQKGADFHWLEANATGRLAKDTPGTLDFGHSLLTATSLPRDLQETLKGVEPGSFKMYSNDKGHYYVLMVEKVVPSRVQSFEDQQKTIKKAVFDKKLADALREWSLKLRDVYGVEIYAKEFKKKNL